ncbi:hypothetical protein HPP92_028180 [Vanilla planifolia]|uniref:Suppressor of forked domain-containing protein n=1 Tax=Vanilla planifolia TaxID=51239 RepID=A0A835P928_VANPL|nr:hypothetical protein HPP92_028180 [Vanilla planifolia]
MSEHSKKVGDGVATDIYNVEAAEILANEAQLLPISDAVPIYEQLVSTFPTAAKFWKQYVEAYMAIKNDEATKQIFSRCLFNCPQISLWRCYIRFIRKINEQKGAEGLEETKKAFEFMLSYVGCHSSRGISTNDFFKLKFTKKAIVTPTHHIEQLWKEYENFENSINRALAKGLLSEYQPKYNSARAVYRERKSCCVTFLAIFSFPHHLKLLAITHFDVILVQRMILEHKEEQQYVAWKRLLIFEKGNPQRIDSVSSNRRITFTFEQCIMFMYHYPDIWYDYATWHAKSGSLDSAIKAFQRALKALPDYAPLKYAYAELEESRGAIQSAKTIYESIVQDNADVISLAYIQFMKFLRRTEAYAMMAFCLDKDVKVAHNVLKQV